MEKGWEKSSEETKKIVMKIVEGLEEIIKTTVNENTRRIAEILKDNLEKVVEA